MSISHYQRFHRGIKLKMWIKSLMSQLPELSGLVWFAFPLIGPVSKLDENTILNTMKIVLGISKVEVNEASLIFIF